jgi:hypothetical protein
MSPFFRRFIEKPILLLLAVNIVVGFFIFRDYGYSWDEPLFYDYAEALGYAYSPTEWLGGSFDLSNSYGASADDHKTRGPAYLLLARSPVDLLEALGLDQASAWHLVNFLFFQLGVYFLYRLAARWMRFSAALAASALFAWQPLLWGHAFINPKDPPFLVFFLASVCLGFEMVDRLADEASTTRQKFSSLILPAVFLGLTTSIRILGPLAGVLVLGYALWKLRTRLSGYITPLVFYGLIAVITMLGSWPYLWENPPARFVEVLGFMSDNPTNLSVLFGGDIFRAGELPRRYLPFMLVTTITEPVWLLFVVGLFAGYWKFIKRNRGLSAQPLETDAAESWRSLRTSLDLTSTRNHLVSLTLVLLWLLTVIAYVFIRKPAMYDGLRHFLFIVPPVFIFTGFALELLIERIAPSWLYAGLIGLLLAPGILGIVRLHPFEYTYYNTFVGGTDGAFRQYETDYWLTCYKDAVENLYQIVNEPARLYVHREAYIADYYATDNLDVQDLRGAIDQVQAGDYVLVNTRTNEDRRVFDDVPPVVQIGRGDAIFCMIKQIP